MYLSFEGFQPNQADTISILRHLIRYTDRGFFKTQLQRFNIANRTKIYKDFGAVSDGDWIYNHLTETYKFRVKRPTTELENHLNHILETSSVQDWLSAATNVYPFSLITRVLDSAEIKNIEGLPLIITNSNDNANT